MNRGASRTIKWIVFIIVLFVLTLGGVSLLGYIWHNVGSHEIAIKFRRSVITDVVGPGVYTDLNPFADIKDIKIEGVKFCAVDPEVLTDDQQRIGVEVCGTVHRPGLDKIDIIKSNWSQYRTFYTSDEALVGKTRTENGVLITEIPGLMQNLAQQAMKVCVGDRIFDEAVVGSARDELRTCIDEEIQKLINNYGGIESRNIVVPNIILRPEVLALEVINTRKADETGRRELAQQQATIRVEQGKVQEKARQDAITAELESEALEARKAVINAQKANELLQIQKDLEIAEERLKVKQTEALAAIAQDVALADLYALHPEFLDYLVQQEWADALADAGAVYVPAGVDPMTIIQPHGAGVDVVVPASPDVSP
jgi:hypothetical protein